MVEFRSAFDFAAEVDRDIEQLSNCDYHLKKGRAKRLLEELLPISRLALLLKRPGLNVEVVGYENDGPVDGHIRISGYIHDEFDVEVTCTYTYEDKLRSELLYYEKFCPGAGPIRRENGKIVAEFEGVDYDAYIDEVAKAILRALAAKNDKTYPDGTQLIIAFDHYKLIGQTNWDRLLASIKKKGGLSSSQFASIYLFNEWSCEIRRVL